MAFGLNPLTLVTFFPLAGLLIVLFLNEEQKSAIRWSALLVAIANFGISLWVLSLFMQSGYMPTEQLEVKRYWLQIAGIPIFYHLRLDGLNILLVLLTTFLTPLAILSTWSAVQEKVQAFMSFFLLLEMGMIGVFLSMDMVLFYVFWEFTLVPMYFLIGIWGGARRIYAAVKFFLFTMSGSLLMLLAILFMGWQVETFSLPELVANRAVFADAQWLLFLAFAIAFAIKVPMWPLHSWLPDAHVEAPTAGSVILAGVLLKMGTYGFLRFNLSLFPEASIQAAPWIGGLAIIGILYGAAVAFAQKDLKKLVAYSSISHLGFVMLGIFALTPEGIAGGILQMVNHGLSTGALFLMVGLLYERRHTRLLADFGGLWKVLPYMGGLTLVVMLSSVGLPGLNGFVGEFTILLGTFGSPYLGPWFAGAAALGVILAAVYLFHMFEKVFLGPVQHEENKTLSEITFREVMTLLPILVVIFWIGLYPKTFFDIINPGVEQLVAVIQSTALALH